MKKKRVFILLILAATLHFLLFPEAPAIQRHNTLSDIKAVKGKVILKWIRNWGGDDEDGDVDKYFKAPRDIVSTSNKSIIICDHYRHCLKVFSETGKLIRTIGGFGQGPGDLFGPSNLQIIGHDDIMVRDNQRGRLQRFSINGVRVFGNRLFIIEGLFT